MYRRKVAGRKLGKEQTEKEGNDKVHTKGRTGE
jgi:hypothetical protein